MVRLMSGVGERKRNDFGYTISNAKSRPFSPPSPVMSFMKMLRKNLEVAFHYALLMFLLITLRILCLKSQKNKILISSSYFFCNSN